MATSMVSELLRSKDGGEGADAFEPRTGVVPFVWGVAFGAAVGL